MAQNMYKNSRFNVHNVLQSLSQQIERKIGKLANVGFFAIDGFVFSWWWRITSSWFIHLKKHSQALPITWLSSAHAMANTDYFANRGFLNHGISVT